MTQVPSKDQTLTGWVGVIDGKPSFGTSHDSKGEFRSYDIFESRTAALDRWAWVRKVTITFAGPEVCQPPSKGRI